MTILKDYIVKGFALNDDSRVNALLIIAGYMKLQEFFHRDSYQVAMLAKPLLQIYFSYILVVYLLSSALYHDYNKRLNILILHQYASCANMTRRGLLCF